MFGERLELESKAFDTPISRTMVRDLMRLDLRIQEDSCENRADRPSVKIQGEAIVKASAEDYLVEFKEKIKILESSFQSIFNI